MLKIKDNVDLKELEKFGLEPIWDCNSKTGETFIRCIVSSRYSGKYGNLSLIKTKRKGLHIMEKIISKNNNHLSLYRFKDDTYIDIDLLYDLIKADLVEKVDDE